MPDCQSVTGREELRALFSTPQNISAIELNLDCPSQHGNYTIGYSLTEIESVLTAITALPHFGSIPLGVILPTYYQQEPLEAVISLICRIGIKFVICSNRIIHCTTPATGKINIAQEYARDTTLDNIHTILPMLAANGRGDIDVIGAGGVRSAEDAYQFILSGAKAVKILSEVNANRNEEEVYLVRIASELEQLMTERGHVCMEDFRGKRTERIDMSRHNFPGAAYIDIGEGVGGVDRGLQRGREINKYFMNIFYTVVFVGFCGGLAGALNTW